MVRPWLIRQLPEPNGILKSYATNYKRISRNSTKSSCGNDFLRQWHARIYNCSRNGLELITARTRRNIKPSCNPDWRHAPRRWAQLTVSDCLYHVESLTQLRTQWLLNYVHAEWNRNLRIACRKLWRLPQDLRLLYNKTLINISKNLNIYESQLGKCENVGVDLNSNYGFNFASDDIGSSGDPCDDHYRGPNAFSEPETTAIKGFLEKWTNIKIAINLQSFGNFFIHPFNYDNGPNTLLHQTYPTADKFY